MKSSKKLVITIIILVIALILFTFFKLILPVVIISKQTDEILNTAQNAKKQNELTKEKEMISLSVNLLKIQNGFDSITEEDLSTELLNNEINALVTEIFDNEEKLFEVQVLDSNNIYKVNNKGTVTLIQE